MARDVLEKIRLAEQQADELVRDAQQSARDMIEQAERSCRERERDGELKSRERYRTLLKERRAQVEQAIAQEAETLRVQREQQLGDCRAKLPQAAELILQRVLADGNR